MGKEIKLCPSFIGYIRVTRLLLYIVRLQRLQRLFTNKEIKLCPSFIGYKGY